MIGTIGACGGAALVLGGGWVGAPAVMRLAAVRRLRETCRRTRSLVLTYDDGPGRAMTPRLLALLRDREARATFFLLGSKVREAPDVVDAIAAGGHEIGFHGQDHVNALWSRPRRVRRDIEAGLASLARWPGPVPCFRPPYGKVTLDSWMAARRLRTPIAWWTLDSGDTWRPLPDRRSVVDAVRRGSGGVVLMHDFDRVRDEAERAGFVLGLTEDLAAAAASEGLAIRTMREILNPPAAAAAPR